MKHAILGRIVFGILLTAIFFQNGFAGVIYVRHNAGASPDGSAANPFAIIQQAIDAAFDGDVVRVAEGTYTEHLTISAKSITIEGGWNSDFNRRDSETYPTAILGDKSGRCFDIKNTLGGEIGGFVLAMGLAGPGGGGGVHTLDSNISLTDCIFIGNETDTKASYQMMDGTASSVIFPPEFYCDGGAMASSGGEVNISDCFFSENVARSHSGAIWGGKWLHINYHALHVQRQQCRHRWCNCRK